MNRLRLLTLIPLLLLVLQLAGQSRSGLISYYNDGLHGNRTTSGERYDKNALTCAGRDWPFGTTLRITRPDNGRAVTVRVNDCGPHRADRLLDVSGAAARELDLIRDGVAQVEVRVVRLGTGKNPCNKAGAATTPVAYDQPTPGSGVVPLAAPPAETTMPAAALQTINGGFGVQVGSFRDYTNAQKLVQNLERRGFTKVLVSSRGNVFRVLVGPFDTNAQAQAYRTNLRRNYRMDSWVVPL